MDNLINVINKITGYVQLVAIPLAILALSFQGLKFFRGDGQTKAEAKDAMFWIVIALVIIFSAKAIISTLRVDMGW